MITQRETITWRQLARSRSYTGDLRVEASFCMIIRYFDFLLNTLSLFWKLIFKRGCVWGEHRRRALEGSGKVKVWHWGQQIICSLKACLVLTGQSKLFVCCFLPQHTVIARAVLESQPFMYLHEVMGLDSCSFIPKRQSRPQVKCSLCDLSSILP